MMNTFQELNKLPTRAPGTTEPDRHATQFPDIIHALTLVSTPSLPLEGPQGGNLTATV